MPYGLFDYTPDSTIHTMGLSPAWNPTTKMVGEECPQYTPPACKDGSIPRVTGYTKDAYGCKIPSWAPCPTTPSCPTTITQGGCTYRRV